VARTRLEPGRGESNVRSGNVQNDEEEQHDGDSDLRSDDEVRSSSIPGSRTSPAWASKPQADSRWRDHSVVSSFRGRMDWPGPKLTEVRILIRVSYRWTTKRVALPTRPKSGSKNLDVSTHSALTSRAPQPPSRRAPRTPRGRRRCRRAPNHPRRPPQG